MRIYVPISTAGTMCVFAALILGAVNCSESTPSSEHLGVTSAAFSQPEGGDDASDGSAEASCSCTGVDNNYNTITTNVCGQAVCGADDLTWVCTQNGFVYQGSSCSDAGLSGNCSCTGVDITGNSVTVYVCGAVVCGLDDATWTCTQNGFEYQGNACSGTGTGACSCSGTDSHGNAVTVNSCGAVVCGADDLTWICTPNGFDYQGDACPVCNCTGTDNNGNQVTTTECGQTVCGADDQTWICTVNGFEYQGAACADAGPPSCSCTGQDSNGNVVSVNSCGQAVCGEDGSEWVCTSTGFQNYGTPCTDGGM